MQNYSDANLTYAYACRAGEFCKSCLMTKVGPCVPKQIAYRIAETCKHAKYSFNLLRRSNRWFGAVRDAGAPNEKYMWCRVCSSFSRGWKCILFSTAFGSSVNLARTVLWGMFESCSDDKKSLGAATLPNQRVSVDTSMTAATFPDNRTDRQAVHSRGMYLF